MWTLGCGIRKKPNDEALVLKEGIIISSGQEAIRDPEKIDDREEMMVDFVGKALVVPDRFMPEYRYIKTRGGNHTFSISPDPDHSFDYLLFAAWSEGEVLNTQKEFEDYVIRTASEFNKPVVVECGEVEKK